MKTENVIEEAALRAIRVARADGAVKYGPDDWRRETYLNQLNHVSDHIEALLYLDAPANMNDLEHALCRLAIAVALIEAGAVE